MLCMILGCSLGCPACAKFSWCATPIFSSYIVWVTRAAPTWAFLACIIIEIFKLSQFELWIPWPAGASRKLFGTCVWVKFANFVSYSYYLMFSCFELTFLFTARGLALLYETVESLNTFADFEVFQNKPAEQFWLSSKKDPTNNRRNQIVVKNPIKQGRFPARLDK